MQNANTLEAMEVARQLILVLKGTVESLQMNLSQERDDNEIGRASCRERV